MSTSTSTSQSLTCYKIISDRENERHTLLKFTVSMKIRHTDIKEIINFFLRELFYLNINM